jgi:hypothetical protein
MDLPREEAGRAHYSIEQTNAGQGDGESCNEMSADGERIIA